MSLPTHMQPNGFNTNQPEEDPGEVLKNYDFWEIINEARAKNREVPRLKPSDYFYPSSSSIIVYEFGEPVVKGSCLRKLYWQRKGEPVTDPISQELGWRAEMGNYVSEMLVEWAKRAGVYVADELAFVDAENNLSGRVDMIYQHPSLKENIGVEIKSVGDYYQRNGTVSGRPDKRTPKLYHLLQVILYLDFFKDHPRYPIRYFELVYIARCTGEHNSFLINLDSEGQAYVDGVPTGMTADMIHARNRQLQQFLDKDEVPPRDFERQYSKEKLLTMAKNGQLTAKQSATVRSGKTLKKGDSACGWCPFHTKCWKEEIDAEQKATKPRGRKKPAHLK